MNSSHENNWQRKKILLSKKHQEKAFETVNELIFKSRKGREIVLEDDTTLIDFVSCSYLGLDLDERVIRGASENLASCGVTFPAARTRIKAKSFIVLEELLNKVFCDTFVVIFNSLHLAHLGFLPLLASGEMPSYPLKKNGVVFLLDRNSHASLQINRGLMEQFGRVEIINFHDLNALEEHFKKISSEDKTAITIADSVGSMGGDAKVLESLNIAQKYKNYIYFDDAHGTSIFGKNGSGYVLEQLNNVYPPSLILTSSLSKAFGSVAGVIVLPSKKDADFVKTFSSTYVFGGPPGLPLIDAAIASAKIHLSDEIYALQDKLQGNLKYFDSLISPVIVLNHNSRSPIRAIFVGDESKTIETALEMRERGIALTAAMYPTVPRERGILRMALSACHKKEQILYACKNINELLL